MATETLRPNTDYNVECDSTGGENNYTEVDEAGGHDFDNTIVWDESGSPSQDLYGIQNSSVGSGVITKVTVKAVMKYHAPE